MPQSDNHPVNTLTTHRNVMPPPISEPEEVHIQLELQGTAEREWLIMRGWSGSKIEEISRMRREAQEELLPQLHVRLDQACQESDIADERLALKSIGDFKRARKEMTELMEQICMLEGLPVASWELKRRVYPSPEVEDLTNEIAGMGIVGMDVDSVSGSDAV
ncbi:hypothetical protein V5O48_009009 [Marasmius crinis-equi]|uniref:Uncharacterized protein n=1 Tax=Marasmius crinis-equi TaxID=585013 RepID=A0ABR3FCB7_9AGAR